MKKVIWLLKRITPEELQNVALVVGEFGAVSKVARNGYFSLLFNMFFWVAGFVVGYVLSKGSQDKILDSMLSFCAIIIGFVITAMLFSGRSQAADKLRLDQVKIYVVKTKYILLSQTQTLIAFLLCVFFCLLAIIVKNSKLSSVDGLVMFSIAMAYFSLGVYRVVFLPFQIYDVHSFSLDSLLIEKDEQTRKEAKKIADGFK